MSVMAEMPQQLYGDSSVFICLLNRGENARRAICEDILRQAQRGNVRAPVEEPKMLNTQGELFPSSES